MLQAASAASLHSSRGTRARPSARYATQYMVLRGLTGLVSETKLIPTIDQGTCTPTVLPM